MPIVECDMCGGIMEEVEGVFMNELGEAEWRGYKCPSCGHTEPEV